MAYEEHSPSGAAPVRVRSNDPTESASEGIPPSQYGTKGLVGDKLTEMEEKYDLTKGTEGFGVKGGEGEDIEEEEAEKEEGEGEEGAAEDEII